MSSSSNAKQPDWTEFTAKSDTRYKKARQERDATQLQSHNLLTGGDVEIGICLALSKLFLGASPQTGRALDLCCGAGYMTDSLRRCGFVTYGVDLNADAISLAKELYPQNQFEAAEITRPTRAVSNKMFDVIFAREAHPFSRLGDFKFQKTIIQRYLKLLNPGGIFIISHARTGGGMDFPSLDFTRLKSNTDLGITAAGPFFPHLIKRVPFSLRNQATCNVLSLGAKFYQRLTNNRLIEIFIMEKSIT